LQGVLPLRKIAHSFINGHIVQALLFTGLAAYPADVRSKVMIVFSAHSLPIRVVARGDQYPPEICATAMEVIQKLRARTAASSPNPYIMAWQSQV